MIKVCVPETSEAISNIICRSENVQFKETALQLLGMDGLPSSCTNDPFLIQERIQEMLLRLVIEDKTPSAKRGENDLEEGNHDPKKRKAY
jgi:hypothetical protein